MLANKTMEATTPTPASIEYAWLNHLGDNNDVDIHVAHADGGRQTFEFRGPNGKLDADIAYRKMWAGEWGW